MQTHDSILGDLYEGSDKADSLFGSPPPSPVRGRSPLLALPSGACSTQNVGTIALPGSHLYSELSVNSPALSLSGFSLHELAHRPPAHVQTGAPPQPSLSRPMSAQSSRSSLTSRASSAVATRKRKTPAKEKPSKPRPAPPPISLPDPDAPPPPNFLRNQQALLGLAGLVGGINPANLSVQRGASANNPIIIEDDFDPRPLGQNSNIPYVDPTKLPTPSNEEIIKSLINQKNIFPVLDSLLKLLHPEPARTSHYRQFHSSFRDRSKSPVTKRRKLASVPAGAVDWDVPYPFASGEGPESYRSNWEKERGKQLVAQLVGLVKSAARKAATKTYLQQQKASEKYYRSSTGTYPSSALPAGVSSASPYGHDRRSSYYSHHQQNPIPSNQPSTPFDNLISSLLAASSPAPTAGSPMQVDALPSSGSGNSLENTPIPDFDQETFENWMSILNSFPELDSRDHDTTPRANLSSHGNTASDAPDASANEHLPTGALQFNSDLNIDPTLLAMSMPSQTQGPPCATASAVSPIPAPIPSPIASTSSLADPLTPQWEGSFPEPDVYTGEQVDDPIRAATMLLQLASTSSSEPLPLLSQATDFLPPPASSATIPPALSSAINTSIQSHHELNTVAITSRTSQPVGANAISRLSRAASGPIRPASKELKKELILECAKERKRQLLAEIERAKVELWETTIEQGVLMQLMKENIS